MGIVESCRSTSSGEFRVDTGTGKPKAAQVKLRFGDARGLTSLEVVQGLVWPGKAQGTLPGDQVS